ncbi:hypothetical protein [Archangium lansingense]|uniref:Uncharacterized protein n=1 Tax=Archangium lansingense TaxID=2995310 RepID=A0ABT3ZZB1_9BACT|nr:hypothetical protein [Archangium lansinium]MCY1074079.1 hypothetical protein [Archangium lansinium]
MLYIQLHPCACGAPNPAKSQGVHSTENGLVARYAGTCERCGRENTFEFTLAPETPPLDAYGGERPSQLICPGQFAQHSDELAARWPADPATLPADKRGAAREELSWAIRDLEEVAKFMVDGAVPEAAFTSDAGLALYRAQPGRFRRMRLEARIEAYRRLVAALGGTGRPATMNAFERVLAEPGSLAARKELLAEWKRKGDRRASVLEKQLLLFEAEKAGGDVEPQRRAVNVELIRDGKALAGELAGLVQDFKFQRGLVAEIKISGADFVARAAKLFTLAPIQHVTITLPLPSVTAFFDVPQLAKLTSLNMPLLGAAFGDAGASALAGCAHAKGLKWISLNKDELTLVGVESLAASTYLADVAFLGLDGNPVDPTPVSQEVMEGRYAGARPVLAEQLEKKFGPRRWLQVPENPEDWPPHREALAIT